MSPQRRSTVFIVNFEHISYFFPPFSNVSIVGFEQVNVLLGPTLSIYKGWNYILLQVLTEMAAHKKGLWSETVVPKNIFSL